MSFNYTIYDVTVTPLTPLHIGSGRLLLNEYDYAIYKNSTWRIDENAWLDTKDTDDPHLVEMLSRTPPAQLIEKKDFRADSPFFRYRMVGKPRATGRGAQLQEMIKTVYDEAYLPGSSLKGAIRTAFAWQGWQEKGMHPNKNMLERNRKFAARTIEKEIMGRDPNHDLLRALHVGDSEPAGKDRFLVLNAQVLTRGSFGSPIELEAVMPDTPFRLTMKVDNQLFSQWAQRHRLRLGGNPAWLNNPAQVIQAFSANRINADFKWFSEVKGAEAVSSFYRQLKNAKLPAGACLLQVGWGTGWGGKTFGSHLQADGRFMEHIISTYRLAKGRRERNDPFPKSRRTTVQVSRDQRGQTRQRVGVPLGWVLMEMKERK